MAGPAQYEITFQKKESFAANTNAFFFTRPTELAFRPGQYLRIILPHENPDERGTSRFFSIASSPTETDHLMIVTKEGPSTFKKTLHSLPDGTKVQIRAPFGSFVLEEDTSHHHVLLTGGIGITPFISMSRYAADKKLPQKITLLASFSIPEEIVLQENFRELENLNPNFRYLVTVTRPEESKVQWNGLTGRINEALLKDHIQDLTNCIYYVVGPEGMVTALVELLRTLGINEDSIRLENFTGY